MSSADHAEGGTSTSPTIAFSVPALTVAEACGATACNTVSVTIAHN